MRTEIVILVESSDIRSESALRDHTDSLSLRRRIPSRLDSAGLAEAPRVYTGSDEYTDHGICQLVLLIQIWHSFPVSVTAGSAETS